MCAVECSDAPPVFSTATYGQGDRGIASQHAVSQTREALVDGYFDDVPLRMVDSTPAKGDPVIFVEECISSWSEEYRLFFYCLGSRWSVIEQVRPLVMDCGPHKCRLLVAKTTLAFVDGVRHVETSICIKSLAKVIPQRESASGAVVALPTVGEIIRWGIAKSIGSLPAITAIGEFDLSGIVYHGIGDEAVFKERIIVQQNFRRRTVGVVPLTFPS